LVRSSLSVVDISMLMSTTRFRGVGEGVFGGIKTRLNGPVRELKPKVAIKRVLLEAAHPADPAASPTDSTRTWPL
jgi:hypothetical protein